jgi:SNF family Na+-dependent transporter
LPALSTSVLRGVNVDGHSLMEILDGVLVNGLLPLAALGLAYGAGRHLTDQATQAEFINDASIATHKLYSHWIFSVRYIVPIAIAGAYALALIGFLLKFRN